MKAKNINFIEDYISVESEYNTIIINQVSNEIGCFYEYLIKEIGKVKKTKIITGNISDENFNETNDLFQKRNIRIYTLTNSRQIIEIAKKKYPKFILTDYRNFIRFKKEFKSLNGYDFERDLNYYLKYFLKINDDILINYCLSHPYFINSEISKFNVNSKNYSIDTEINVSKNFILKTRGDIFKMKSSNSSLKEILERIKEEVTYKKFSFLTY